MPAELHIPDYRPPPGVRGWNPVALKLSNAIFVLVALAFVPLHAIVGRNVAIGLVSLVAFIVGAALAGRPLISGPRRPAAFSFSINVLGLFFVAAYLVHFWPALEPLSALGK